jgi:hypothetical protein
VELVTQVNVSEETVGVDGLRTEGHGDNPKGERLAGDKVVLGFSLHQKVGEQANEKGEANGESHRPAKAW